MFSFVYEFTTVAFEEALGEDDELGPLRIQSCCKSSKAVGRASQSTSKVRCRKSVASGEISVGIAGFAEEPSYSKFQSAHVLKRYW